MASQLRFFLLALDLDHHRQTSDQIAKTAGKNVYYLKRLLPTLKKNHQISNLKQAIWQLSQADIMIKSGQMSSQHALIWTITNLFNVEKH